MTLKSSVKYIIIFVILWIFLSTWHQQINQRHFICNGSDLCFTIWQNRIVLGKYYGFKLPRESYEIIDTRIVSFDEYSRSVNISNEWVNTKENDLYFVSFSADPIPELLVYHNDKIVLKKVYILSIVPVLSFIAGILIDTPENIAVLLIAILIAFILSKLITRMGSPP